MNFSIIYMGIAAIKGGKISFMLNVMPKAFRSIIPSAIVIKAKEIIELIIAPSMLRAGIFTSIIVPESFSKIPASWILKGS